MISARFGKPLIPLQSLRWPRTRIGASIYARLKARGAGQGYNATTVEKPTVVGTVVGENTAKTTAYHISTTIQRSKCRFLTYVRARARAHVGVSISLLYRCSLKEVSEFFGKMPTTVPTTVVETVVGTVVASAKPLFLRKKGGIYAETR